MGSLFPRIVMLRKRRMIIRRCLEARTRVPLVKIEIGKSEVERTYGLR